MKKKITSLVLALTLILALSAPAFATQPTSQMSTDTTFDEKVQSLTRSVLQFIEPEKSLYNLGSVDFSLLYLGEQIPAYFMTDTGMVEQTSICYFPIMESNTWVATSIVSYDSAGKMNVQISTEYAEVYENATNAGNEIALLFDENKAYIVADEEVIEAAVSTGDIAARVSLDEYEGIINPEKSFLNSQNTRSVGTDGASEFTLDSDFNKQGYISIPGIKQATGSKQCWAACIASIRGYYGNQTTIDDVYNFSMVPKYEDRDIITARAVMTKYGLVTQYYTGGFFNFYQMRTEIHTNERPIFTACKFKVDEWTTLGHAVVIRGYYVYENANELGIISYMDPTTGAYGATSVATDSKFYYIPSDNSVKYTMDAFAAAYKR